MLASPNVSPQTPTLHARALLSPGDAEEVAALFKLLGNSTRIRLLHALVRAGELCVTDLAEEVEMKPQAVSNQLQRLVDRKVLSSRRNGTNIYYRVVDSCVRSLLDYGLCLVEDSANRLADGNGGRRDAASGELHP